MFYPKVVHKNTITRVIIRPYEEQPLEIKIELVLDFDLQGELVGIEVLDFARQVGKERAKKVLHTTSCKYLDCSYDKWSDAFYLRLTEGSSSEQLALEGKSMFGENGDLLGFYYEREFIDVSA